MPTPITKIPPKLKTKELAEEDISRLSEITEQLESCLSGKQSFILLSSDDPDIEVEYGEGVTCIKFGDVLFEDQNKAGISRGPFGDLND